MFKFYLINDSVLYAIYEGCKSGRKSSDVEKCGSTEIQIHGQNLFSALFYTSLERNRVLEQAFPEYFKRLLLYQVKLIKHLFST